MPFDIPHIVGGLLAAAAIPASLLGTADWLSDAPPEHPFPVAQTVAVAGRVAYPLPGEFLRDGRPAAAPRRSEVLAAFEIMTFQVSLLEYGRCVAAAACRPADTEPGQALRTPVTGVSHIDAEAYAAWYSRATGERWRLPTAAEWALAAGERFSGEDLPVIDDPDNPAQRWLSAYRSESARPIARHDAAAARRLRRQCPRALRPRRQRLGMDLDLLRAFDAGGRCEADRVGGRELRRPRARGTPPRLHVELHPRREEWRLRGRQPARQSRLPPRARTTRRRFCRAPAPDRASRFRLRASAAARTEKNEAPAFPPGPRFFFHPLSGRVG